MRPDPHRSARASVSMHHPAVHAKRHAATARGAHRHLAWPNLPHWARWGIWPVSILSALIALFLLAGIFVDRPLRGYMENRLNDKLRGYTVRLRAADFRPIGFGLVLRDLVLVQDARPDPPVLEIPEIGASVQWKALLRARLVADVHLDKPAIYLDRRHVEIEHRDQVPIQDRGWQDAFQAIYPLKFNEVRLEAGELTYLDREHTRPLQLHGMKLLAANIRNIRSGQGSYPSDLNGSCTVFDRGSMSVEGNADFLAKPHIAINARVAIADVLLDYFAPLLERQNLVVRRGWLDAVGHMEYAPQVRRMDLEKLLIRDLDVDYVHATGAAAKEKGQLHQVAAAARELSQHPTLELRAKQVQIQNGRLGWVNRSTDPNYRLFLSDLNLDLRNFSNQFSEGTGTADLQGRFMGSGPLKAAAQFRPEKNGPDFDLRLRVERTPLTALNDLLRAHGRFDVVGGVFSLYSEVQVQNGRIRGYVKPLFKDIDVYDPKQDKGFFSKIWEALVGAVANILSNRERDEVATVADISGPISKPDTSTWQIIGNLIKNAFIDAILPGFDREVASKKKQ